jgi:hypothetical protein
MRTEVKLEFRHTTREMVWEVDLPTVPKDHLICVPTYDWCTVVLSYINISPASGPMQVLVVRQGR